MIQHWKRSFDLSRSPIDDRLCGGQVSPKSRSSSDVVLSKPPTPLSVPDSLAMPSSPRENKPLLFDSGGSSGEWRVPFTRFRLNKVNVILLGAIFYLLAFPPEDSILGYQRTHPSPKSLAMCPPCKMDPPTPCPARKKCPKKTCPKVVAAPPPPAPCPASSEQTKEELDSDDDFPLYLRATTRYIPLDSLRKSYVPAELAFTDTVDMPTIPPGWLTARECSLLYYLAKFASGPVYEQGSWRGRATSCVARGIRDSGVTRLFISSDVFPIVDESFPVGKLDKETVMKEEKAFKAKQAAEEAAAAVEDEKEAKKEEAAVKKAKEAKEAAAEEQKEAVAAGVDMNAKPKEGGAPVAPKSEPFPASKPKAREAEIGDNPMRRRLQKRAAEAVEAAKPSKAAGKSAVADESKAAKAEDTENEPAPAARSDSKELAKTVAKSAPAESTDSKPSSSASPTDCPSYYPTYSSHFPDCPSRILKSYPYRYLPNPQNSSETLYISDVKPDHQELDEFRKTVEPILRLPGGLLTEVHVNLAVQNLTDIVTIVASPRAPDLEYGLVIANSKLTPDRVSKELPYWTSLLRTHRATVFAFRSLVPARHKKGQDLKTKQAEMIRKAWKIRTEWLLDSFWVVEAFAKDGEEKETSAKDKEKETSAKDKR